MSNQKTPTCEELRALYERIYPHPRPPGNHRSPLAENHMRMKRALSWLQRCEGTFEYEIDERFLFLWIAFNAAYGDDRILKPAQNPGDAKTAKTEYDKFSDFLKKIIARDTGYRLADIIGRHRDQFRAIIDNRFLFNFFWKAEYRSTARAAWEQAFRDEQQCVHKALDDKHLETSQTSEVLRLTFNRLYTLRNQILHGGASWRSRYNRSSLQSGDAILGLLVPEILKSMLDSMEKQPDTREWGTIAYPPYLETPDDTSQGPPGTTAGA